MLSISLLLITSVTRAEKNGQLCMKSPALLTGLISYRKLLLFLWLHLLLRTVRVGQCVRTIRSTVILVLWLVTAIGSVLDPALIVMFSWQRRLTILVVVVVVLCVMLSVLLS